MKTLIKRMASAAMVVAASGLFAHTITVDKGPYGQMVPATHQQIANGEDATFRFGPEIEEVFVDGLSMGAVESYTFENVTGDHAIRAVFRSPFAAEVMWDDTFGYPGTNDFKAVILNNPTMLELQMMWIMPESVLGKPNLAMKSGNTADAILYPISLILPIGLVKGTPDASYVGELATNVPPEALRLGGLSINKSKNGAEIVVAFDHDIVADPRNPFGLDFIVHGNAFFSANGGVSPTDDIESRMLGGLSENTPVIVSVAQSVEGPWYDYAAGPYGDGMFPTQPFAWDRQNKTWGAEHDWTKPVDPTLTIADFKGLNAADGVDLYDGSAGGAGFSLAETGWDWIRYVKFTDPNGDGEICGVADVSAYLGTYPVTVNAMVGGTVSIATGDYDSGRQLAVKAIPDAGYMFSEWVALPPGAIVNGDSVSVTVNRAMTFQATFVEDPNWTPPVVVSEKSHAITNITISGETVCLAWTRPAGKTIGDLNLYAATSLTNSWSEVTNGMPGVSITLDGATVPADAPTKFFMLFVEESAPNP